MLKEVSTIFSQAQLQGDASGPITRAYVPTPSNTVPLPRGSRGLMCSGGGNVVVHFVGEPDDNATVTLTGLVSGQIYPFAVDKILATGTTATGLLVLE